MTEIRFSAERMMTVQLNWRAVARRWRLVVGVTMVALLFSAIVTALLPREYTSTVSFYISNQGADSAAAAYQGSLLSADRIKSYTALIQGTRLAAEVREDLGLSESPQELAGRVGASSEQDTVLISASYRDSDPVRARIVADAVAERFVALVAELETPPGGAAAPVVARVVESASVPTSPSFPDWPLNLAVSLVLGFIGGAIAALVRDSLDQQVRDREELAELTGVPFLGSIPESDGFVGHALEVGDGNFSAAAESIRKVRSSLTFVSVDAGSSKILAVSSASQGEGKTTVTANVGLALAQSGYQVLLIEADLRRPFLSQIFGLDSTAGLSTVLSGRTNLDGVLQWSRVNLAILSAGGLPPNPSEILGSQRMEQLMVEARDRFDFVLIDTPPVLAVADAGVVARQCDSALLVVKYGATSRKEVVETVENLKLAGVSLAGCVLTMAPPGSFSSSYYYGRVSDSPIDQLQSNVGPAPSPGKRRRSPSPTPTPRAR